jgi:hypothetical protein
MNKAELKRNGVTGYQLRLALLLKQQTHDLVYVAVTVIFAISTLLYLFFDDNSHQT